MSIDLSISNGIKIPGSKREEICGKNGSPEKSLPNPINLHGSSSNGSSAASFKATKLQVPKLKLDQKPIQIQSIILPLGFNKPVIFISEKTLQKFKEHCPSVGFIKLLTGELQLNLQSRGLWFLKILAMVDCADDFKEILRDCYYLERLQVDETAFDELFHLAKDLGLEDIIKNNREKIINKPLSIIFDNDKKIIDETTPSFDACQRLSDYSTKLKKELSKSVPTLTVLFKELLYDAGVFDLNNPHDVKLKDAFDRLKLNRGPFRCINLVEETKFWDLDDLQEKYIEELFSKTLNMLKTFSADIQKAIENRDKNSILYNISSTVELAAFFYESSPDEDLLGAFHHFFEIHLRELIIYPDLFDKLIELIFDIPLEKLDFSNSNLQDKPLLQLAKIKSLKEIDIKDCKQLTNQGLKDFKQAIKQRKVKIACDKDLEDTSTS